MSEKKSALIVIILRLKNTELTQDSALIISGGRFKGTNVLNVERPLVKI